MGDVDAKAKKLLVGVDEKLNPEDIKKHLLVHAPEDKKELSERVCRDVVGGVGKAGGLWAHQGEQSGLPCLGGRWGAGGRHSGKCSCPPQRSRGGELAG